MTAFLLLAGMHMQHRLKLSDPLPCLAISRIVPHPEHFRLRPTSSAGGTFAARLPIAYIYGELMDCTMLEPQCAY